MCKGRRQLGNKGRMRMSHILEEHIALVFSRKEVT